MDENIRDFRKKILEKVKDNLEKNGFDKVVIVQTKEEAKRVVLDEIEEGKSVGIGGSQSIREMGLIDELKKRNRLLIHSPSQSQEERLKIWREALTSDYYLCSVNAITYNGKLFFIDAYGNRLCAAIFGPKEVILVIGFNKIVMDEEEAMLRIRNKAGVINAIRLKKNTPCVKEGVCLDCNSEDRICNVISILMKRPKITEYLIVLSEEDLGY